MATLASTILTPRDLEILIWLYRTPLTVEQLLKLSGAFATPFQSGSRVRGRLARLREAGWVRSFRYAMSQRGTPAEYYKLTLSGYRILYGEDAMPPTKRFFAECGIARQHHTHSLAEFLVHTAVGASQAGAMLREVTPENTLRLELDGDVLYPDGAFQLATATGGRFNFCVELDCGTERVRSGEDRDSLERKLRFYDRYQDQAAERFRVLFVGTRSAERVRHILDTAQAVVRNPRRSLAYGIVLADYLKCFEAVTSPCFLDQRGEPAALTCFDMKAARSAIPVGAAA